ncbi:putative quorum-quenching lactonase YtnP [mine drainage metagenome]|uniref:Putative quorum-quenching lactonase YtnP n=1 Tax=mine drainage metagenome TaxID=410659 RepID=A0A1J5SYX8_9ZZZZ
MVRNPNLPIYRFNVGDFECATLAAFTRDIPSPHPFFAPQATSEQLAAALARECLPSQSLRLYFNVLLVRTGRQNILIDAGFARNAVPAAFNVADNLASLGLEPGDIDSVILTHAHGDHMGGLLDDAGKPVFTRAQHFCSAEEIDFWTSPKPDFSKSRLDEKSQAASIAAARQVFAAIPFSRITPTATLPDGLTATLAPGHTPGHINLRIRSGAEVLHHMVDLGHHFAVMLPHPDWTVGFDVNPDLAVATRREIFPKLAAEGARVFGYHMPFPALGHIQASGDGFRWVPELWDAHL